MEMFSIASGSSGNCICVGNDDCHVMVDCGISGKRVEAGMNRMDFTTSDMAAVLITHEHADHIAGLGVIARRYGLPIYATKGTIDAIISANKIGKVDPGLFHIIKADCEFNIGSLTVRPVSVSHDAAEPVAYIVSDPLKNKSIGIITDLGVFDDYIVENISDLDAILLEANHDVKMLQTGPYPYPLKQRILSDRGHLSNELSGRLLSRVLHDNMKHIFLGHLSKENNYDKLALTTVGLEVTMSQTPYKAKDFPIEVAFRDEVSRRIAV